MFTGEKRGHYRSEPRGWSSHLITRKGNHPGQLEIPQGPGAEWQICHQLRQEEESWRLRWNRRGTKGEKKKESTTCGSLLGHIWGAKGVS